MAVLVLMNIQHSLTKSGNFFRKIIAEWIKLCKYGNKLYSSAAHGTPRKNLVHKFIHNFALQNRQIFTDRDC